MTQQRGRPRQPLTVTDDEREVLERWSLRPKSPHSIAERARIVLLSADGLTNNEVAERVGMHQATGRLSFVCLPSAKTG